MEKNSLLIWLMMIWTRMYSYCSNDNEVVVIIMPIRNGKIVGRDDFLMSGSQYGIQILKYYLHLFSSITEFNRHIQNRFF